MKTYFLLLIPVLFFVSCSKEYSATQVKEEIKVYITGSKYVTTVNGSTGEYWKIHLSVSKPLDKEIRVVYEFDDNRVKGMTISHPINKGSTDNIAFTQYLATGVMGNIKLIRVDGDNEHIYTLQN